jgi:lysophospholipase L1-like esterase
MKTILCYGDSVSWGIIPNSRNRLPFEKRWTGVMQNLLGSSVHVIE